MVYANTAQSFALTKKLVAVKEPIFAAKVQFVRDVKDKVVLVANKVRYAIQIIEYLSIFISYSLR